MCGVAGILARASANDQVSLETEVANLTDTMVHRGPDDGGSWVDSEAGIALGHRRLAVVDLSVEGRQPMQSACGRYVVVYNGEIYNHLQLRAELGPQTWRGHSDTETLLAAVVRWGVEGAIRRCAGMFAIALWDRNERRLYLLRDRLGEKPLYYGWVRSQFVFGSELKAIARHSAFAAGVDREALVSLLARGYIDSGRSIYEGINSLTPGAMLTLSREQPTPVVTRFWDLAAVAAMPRNHALSPEAAVDELEARLGQVIGEQVVADVPVGAFLSGGIDSSTVVALMRAHSSHAVRTFTVGFESRAFDESPHARAVADHLGTQHTELRIGDAEVRAAIPTVSDTFDEPFGDSSSIPTYLVSRLARQHVTVALSGDGGDELFCGYTRYLNLDKHWARISGVPRPLRRLAGAVAGPFARGGLQQAQLVAGAAADDAADFYEYMTRKWRAPRAVVLGAVRAPGARIPPPGPVAAQAMETAMYTDMLGYLPADILVKVDRAGMRCSLESRIPMLDYRLVEWAWTLPVNLKLRAGTGKWLLRKVLERHVPASLFERPKMGFGVPLDEWLRGSLREWAEDLLSEGTLRQQGYFDARAIRATWQRHLAGANLRDALWPVLMFQAWLARRG
jgi:asparagine synthase (glutamine-hydrolysing)